MPKFGDFETVGEPVAFTERRSHVATIWKARKSGVDDGRFYAVKCYSPRRRNTEAEAEAVLERDSGLKFAEGIKDLRKAGGSGGGFLARVHDFGINSEGVWYVTDFYPRTLAKFITLRGRVDSGGLRHVIESLVAGCLALKRTRGYSHGNLKTGNVFLVGPPRALRKTGIHLGDPYPAAPDHLSNLDAENRQMVGELLQQTVEAHDLRSIGELIFQLVEGRLIFSGENEYPIRDSPAWRALGKDSERWRDFCNRLLDPNLSLERVNLGTLEAEFRPSALASNLPRILVVLAAAGLIGGVAYLLWPPVKLTPVIKTLPTTKTLFFGQILSASELTGGEAINTNKNAKVNGHFAFVSPSIGPVAGVTNVPIRFIPTDSKAFKTVAASVPVTVAKATPVLTVPKAMSIAYGQPLKSSTLVGGAAANPYNHASVPGQFEFADASQRPNVGLNTVGLIFMPTDTTDYCTVSNDVTVNVEVTKATPVFVSLSASQIAEGDELVKSVLNGTVENTNNHESVDGSLAFIEPSYRPEIGTGQQAVRFTPRNSARYGEARAKVNVTVVPTKIQKMTPLITMPKTKEISYGQPLQASISNSGEAINPNNREQIPGHFTLEDSSLVPHAGTTKMRFIFTPRDLEKYYAVTNLLSVFVSKATPVLTPLIPGPISFGEELSDSRLAGTASNPNSHEVVAGAFVFTGGAPHPQAGPADLKVTFMPSNTDDYNAVTTSVHVTVNRVKPNLTVKLHALPLVKGQMLMDSAVTNEVQTNLPGAFAFTNPKAHPNQTADQPVTFTPLDTNNYFAITDLTVNVLVNPVAAKPVTPEHAPTNLFGIDFVWVNGIHGPGAFVEQTEMSQREYTDLCIKIRRALNVTMPDITNTPQYANADEEPVIVPFMVAQNLCRELTEAEKTSNGVFALPSRADFLIYSEVKKQTPAVNPQWTELTGMLQSLHANTALGLSLVEAASHLPKPVKSGQPNEFHLFNVLGNVWEWCDTNDVAGFSSFSTGGRSDKFLFNDAPASENNGVRLLFIPAPAPH